MQVVRLIIVAVGGQGNLLAAKVLGEAALFAGVPVHMSEIHGMAQRGGVVESAIVFGNAASSIISDNEADLLVGFEPAETLRALNRAHADTWVVTSTSPLPPFTAALGKGVYPKVMDMLALMAKKTKKVIAFDALELARQANNPLAVNMVLVGALAATSRLPFGPEAIKKAIETTTKEKFVPANLKAFELGFGAVS